MVSDYEALYRQLVNERQEMSRRRQLNKA